MGGRSRRGCWETAASFLRGDFGFQAASRGRSVVPKEVATGAQPDFPLSLSDMSFDNSLFAISTVSCSFYFSPFFLLMLRTTGRWASPLGWDDLPTLSSTDQEESQSQGTDPAIESDHCHLGGGELMQLWVACFLDLIRPTPQTSDKRFRWLW